MPAPQYVLLPHGVGSADVAQLLAEMGSGAQSFAIAPTTGWVGRRRESASSTVGPSPSSSTASPPRWRRSCLVGGPGSDRGGRGLTSTPTTVGQGAATMARLPKPTNLADHLLASRPVGEHGRGHGSQPGRLRRARRRTRRTRSVSPIGSSVPFNGTPLTLPTNFLVEDGIGGLSAPPIRPVSPRFIAREHRDDGRRRPSRSPGSRPRSRRTSCSG